MSSLLFQVKSTLVATPHRPKQPGGASSPFSSKDFISKMLRCRHSLGDFAIKSVTILIPEAKQAGQLTTSPSSQELIIERVQWSMGVSGTWPFHEAK